MMLTTGSSGLDSGALLTKLLLVVSQLGKGSERVRYTVQNSSHGQHIDHLGSTPAS